jgi:hypothetical protein
VASSLVVCGARPASSSQHGEHELALPYIFGDARALAGLIEERLPFSADAAVEVEPDEAETVRRDASGARTRSSCGEFVFVDQAAEEIAPVHLRSVRRRDRCDR